MSKGITKQSKNFSKWYTDVIQKAELADYAPVKGCMIIRPYGYSIWENIQKYLDKMIKNTGCQNAYFPIFIPESFLNKEKEHVEGFAPECAVVTYGGGSELTEKLIVRPTSETIMYYMYAKWINSYRDLPILINQWANVVRWEMRTRLFLRTSEFLWQEGHTAHATQEEAEERTIMMLNIYEKFLKEYLAIPVIKGLKSENEKFAGANKTYTIEALMKDKKCLQAGTSHNLGQNFSKVFGIKFLDKEGKQQYVWQTSWGVSTRLIGALIMVHGDNKGLILPPKVAPYQVVIVPIWKNEEEQKQVTEAIKIIEEKLKNIDIRIHSDLRTTVTPGFKFNDWEMRGIPLRIEIGPKDIEKKSCVVALRHTFKKISINLDKIEKFIPETLEKIQKELYERALEFLKENTHTANTFVEFSEIIQSKGGIISSHWCGKKECELKIKEKTKATLRCIPLDAKNEEGKCIICGERSNKKVLFSRSY